MHDRCNCNRNVLIDFSEQLTCHGSQGVEPIPPHLSHSINATEINVELIDLNATVRAMRVGAEIALVANESVPNAFNVAERKLVDDGRAPGDFRMVDVLSPGAMNNSKGTFLYDIFLFNNLKFCCDTAICRKLHPIPSDRLQKREPLIERQNRHPL